MWIHNDKEFLLEENSDYFGFVYLITDLSNDKKYIGKKWFWKTRKLPPLKGKSRRRNKKSESDWKDYFGSSEEVKAIVEEKGPKNFKREILRLCKSKGECTYFEAKFQFDNEVLLRDDYYNEFIGCKIHSKHVSDLKNDSSRDPVFPGR